MKSSLYSLRSLAYCCATSSLLIATLDVQAAISQSPLSLTIGVPPNIIFTLDDSGSMSWGYVPDSIESSVLSGSTMTRLYAASEFNSMYYNPNTEYTIPPYFDDQGNEVTLGTAFTKAFINGFRPNDGNLDLSNNYRATGKEYRMPSGSHNRLNNPSNDFSVSISFSSNETKTETSAAGIKFSVTRSGKSGNRKYECSIVQTGPVIDNSAFNCSRNSNTYTAEAPAFYYTYDASLNNCNSTKSDEDCYKLVFVSNSEKNNFATWYSFYRTRALATLSATSIAFTNLSPTARLTWQSLVQCTGLNGGNSSSCKDNKLRQYDQLHKGQLYTWLSSVYFNNSTPLPAAIKRAGEFLKDDTPWLKYPNSRNNGDTNNTSNTYACRPSYHIMMTDGMWNSTTSNPSNFRQDSTTFTLPDLKSYSKQNPYQDNYSETLADLAMHYWATDLKPGLDNKLSPFTPFTNDNATTEYWDPRNDPASWQHMTNFIMGLGLSSSMNASGIPWEGSTFQGAGYEALKNGSKPWPEAKSGSNNNVYDLWHAAINSRGEFFSVDSPEDMVQAFSDILNRIADRTSTAAKPAINSGQVVVDENDPNNSKLVTSSYQTSYASDENWSGDLKRTNKEWTESPAGSGKFELSLIEKWSAKTKMPSAAARKIYIPGGNSSGLQDFTWANAGNKNTSGTLANYLSIDPEIANKNDDRGEARLNYLRGERTGEGTIYRTRSGILGDLFSSSPSVVGGARYLTGVANNLEGNDTYTSFKESLATRSTRVYVGGNDGMLHGFNAETGVEEFAFIPTAVFPNLNKLTGTNYGHQFYVDGSPVVADIYDGSKWRTILVGTLRAGGRSIFALDITTPGNEKLLWEFDDSKIVAPNTVKMGYSFSQPTIARLHNGRWAVVFGNGYEASSYTNGKAALFIVDALEGTLEKSLEVTGTNGTANGLSTPRIADNNGDSVADYAYAGDLQGNLWRFDLLPNARNEDNPLARSETETRTSVSQYQVAYGGKPMFTAVASNTSETPQSITAAPALVRHPTGVGHLVIFATGKYFEDTDKDGNKSIAQTVYGIWDEKSRGEKEGTTSALGITRAKLVEQTISSQVTATDSNASNTAARIISQNAITWDEKKGWLLELKQGSTLDGEMVIEPMITIGQTVYFQSLIPNDDPCADGASNWTYGLNAYTGGKTPYNAFDMQQVNPDGTTSIVSAIKQDGEGGLTVTDTPDGLEICTGQGCEGIKPPPNINARNSWRRIEETE
ncbi:MAG: pilus assembly protein PilY [Gammaproteobacteria bacterium]|nr:pilus assembly protein PilY [Gammaproteobacteria bacterium]MBU0882857.1 pilus assembly protein PilY [Gammaproteobacteria bacterium]MBU1861946.1 pilus assembly protein PilY [Gammaproteobacteria bacterium]